MPPEFSEAFPGWMGSATGRSWPRSSSPGAATCPAVIAPNTTKPPHPSLSRFWKRYARWGSGAG